MHGAIKQAFRVEWRSLSELRTEVDPWQDLTTRVLEPNIFYHPAFAMGARPAFGREAGAALVWSRGDTPRLLGLFPAYIEQRRYGWGPDVLTGWTHPFAPLGTPLVDATNAEGVIAAWLDFIAAEPTLPNLMLLPFLAVEGPFARTLDAVLAREAIAATDFGLHRRAILEAGTGRTTYLARTLGPKQRKELPRLRRRLEEAGTLTQSCATTENDVAHALGAFLELETSGWKGRAGTAAVQDHDIRRFMVSAVTGLARDGKVRVDLLSIDKSAIAAMVTLRSGATAYSWKIAYDEKYARYSPGVQLVVDVTEALLADPTLARIDSCAAALHPMIDHVWRERLALADRLFLAGTKGGMAYATARMLERTRRFSIAGTKSLRDRVTHR